MFFPKPKRKSVYNIGQKFVRHFTRTAWQVVTGHCWLLKTNTNRHSYSCHRSPEWRFWQKQSFMYGKGAYSNVLENRNRNGRPCCQWKHSSNVHRDERSKHFQAAQSGIPSLVWVLWSCRHKHAVPPVWVSQVSPTTHDYCRGEAEMVSGRHVGTTFSSEEVKKNQCRVLTLSWHVLLYLLSRLEVETDNFYCILSN